MDALIGWLQRATGLNPDLLHKVLTSVLTVLVVWVLHRLIVVLVLKHIGDLRLRYRLKKTSGYVLFLGAVIILGRIWFEGFQTVATFFGLLSAGIAIALRDLLVNLAGWIFIIWRRPLEVGDRIQVGEHAGDVIDIRVFQFTLMEIGNWVGADQSTGRIIHIPNGRVFTEPIANYSKGFQYIWNEVPVLITFESNWRKAKEILLEIAARHAEHLSKAAEEKVREAARKFMIFYTKLTPTVYTSVEESGILLTIRYLCEPRRRRNSEQAIWEDILSEFAKCDDIDFAYPTRRYFDNVVEGKPGTRRSATSEPNPGGS